MKSRYFTFGVVDAAIKNPIKSIVYNKMPAAISKLMTQIENEVKKMESHYIVYSRYFDWSKS